MHRELLKVASPEILHDFLMEAFDELRKKDYDMYEELELELYKDIYGCHFSSFLLDKALSKMVNEDGTKGGHWTLGDTNSVAKSMGITFNKYNEYDWCYVMNMIYSDYYGVLSNDTSVYGHMAKKFLTDKDAPEGKALHYYLAMRD